MTKAFKDEKPLENTLIFSQNIEEDNLSQTYFDSKIFHLQSE